jgi:hypothetical protein
MIGGGGGGCQGMMVGYMGVWGGNPTPTCLPLPMSEMILIALWRTKLSTLHLAIVGYPKQLRQG